jgi:hypothetical protein
MKKNKKILSKNLFEATYVASDPKDVKDLKSSGVLSKDDTVMMDDEKSSSNSNDDSMALSENENNSNNIISFKLAKILKEKGFNKPVSQFYTQEGDLSLDMWNKYGKIPPTSDYNAYPKHPNAKPFYKYGYSAPTIDIVLPWIREKYNMDLNSEYQVLQLFTNNLNENTEESKQPIKVEYLSNMKGEEPFEIQGDKYEYVWGKYPDGERKPAVYCYKDDITISEDWFNENIAKHKENMNENSSANDDCHKKIINFATWYSGMDRLKVENAHKRYLNETKQLDENSGVNRPKDVNGNDITIKARVVINNSEIGHVLQFGLNDKNEEVAIVELINGRKVKVPFNQIIVDDNSRIVREEQNDVVDGTNIPKLQQDVKILVDKISTVLKPYLDKINKPVEQAELIAAIAERIGIPREKLSGIIGKLRTISKQTNIIQQDVTSTSQVNENESNLKKVNINGTDFYADEMKRTIYTSEDLKNKISWDRLNSFERQQIYDQLKNGYKINENRKIIKTIKVKDIKKK